MSELFEDIEDFIWYEDISSREEYDGGLQECEIYYCPYMQVEPFAVPSIYGSFEGSGFIDQEIVARKGYSFQRIKALIDNNDLNTSGSTTKLNIYVLGLRAKIIGLKRKLEMMPGIYLVRDNNQRCFVIGNTLSPARASVTLSSGKTIEDLSGAQIQLTSNMIFFEYKGVTPEVNNKSDFTDEHSNEYQ